MARIHGYKGTVDVSGGIIGVTRWTFTPTASADETTGMDSSGYRTYLPGLMSGTLSVEGKWDSGGEPVSILDDATCTFTLKTTTAAPVIHLTGTCVVTQSRIEVPVDGPATIAIEATGTAAWSETAGYA